MLVPHDPRLPSSSVLDALFTRLDRGDILPLPPPHRPASRIEEEWVSEEKETLEEFTRRQLALLKQQQSAIEQQRADVLRRQHELNEACLLRQQELNRRTKEMEARAQTVEERETDLTGQEKQVAVELQRLGRARQDLQEYRQETADQQREVEELKTETLTLIERERDSRRQLGEVERTLQERWAVLAATGEEQERSRQTLEQLSVELARRRLVLNEREKVLGLEEAQERVAQLREAAASLRTEVERLTPREEWLSKRVAVLESALAERQSIWREQQDQARGERRRIDLLEEALTRRTAELEQRELHVETMLLELMRFLQR